MAVNAYGNDVYIGQEDCESDTPLQMYDQNTPFATDDKKKKDPVADDVLRDQQEFHEMLRRPLLLLPKVKWSQRPSHRQWLNPVSRVEGISSCHMDVTAIPRSRITLPGLFKIAL